MTAEKETGASCPSYRERKHRLRSVRRMLLAIAAVQLAVTAAVSTVTSFFDAPPPSWIPILLIELLAYLVPLSLYAKSNRLLTARTARERFGLRPCRKQLWGWVITGALGCQFVMILLNLPLNFLLPAEEASAEGSLLHLLSMLLVVGAIPALFEEFLFRGIVYGVMKEFNTRAAMIFTSVIFAVMHGSLTGFLGYLYLGWATTNVLERTRSLYAAMAFHLINNMVAILLSRFSPWLLSFPVATLWFFVLGVLATLTAFAGLKRHGYREDRTPLMPTKDLLGQSFLSLPILLCIACILGGVLFC